MSKNNSTSSTCTRYLCIEAVGICNAKPTNPRFPKGGGEVVAIP